MKCVNWDKCKSDFPLFCTDNIEKHKVINNYCNGHYNYCARYILSVENNEKSPYILHPDDIKKVVCMLSYSWMQ